MTPASLAKKTKTELIEEYQHLLERQKELESGAKEAYKPAHDQLFEKVSAYSDESLEQSVATIRTTFSAALNKLTESLHGEAQKFQDMRQALEVSKQRLAFQHQGEVAAGLIEKMLAEYEAQKQQLEQEIATRGREWERAHEEKEYHATLTQKRAQATFDELCKKREAELTVREANYKLLEAEHADLRAQVTALPDRIAKEVEKKTAEIKKQYEAESTQNIAMQFKEFDFAKKVLEADTKNLREQIARQQSEIAALRKDIEIANKKAQELAIRIVESTHAMQGQTTNTPVSPTTEN